MTTDTRSMDERREAQLRELFQNVLVERHGEGTAEIFWTALLPHWGDIYEALRRTQSEAVRTEGVKDGWLKDDMERASASVEQWKSASLSQHAQSGVVEALRPFAELADSYSDHYPDTLKLEYVDDGNRDEDCPAYSFTLGDLRRARDALATPSPAVAESELREAAREVSGLAAQIYVSGLSDAEATRLRAAFDKLDAALATVPSIQTDTAQPQEGEK